MLLNYYHIFSWNLTQVLRPCIWWATLVREDYKREKHLNFFPSSFYISCFVKKYGRVEQDVWITPHRTIDQLIYAWIYPRLERHGLANVIPWDFPNLVDCKGLCRPPFSILILTFRLTLAQDQDKRKLHKQLIVINLWFSTNVRITTIVCS